MYSSHELDQYVARVRSGAYALPVVVPSCASLNSIPDWRVRGCACGVWRGRGLSNVEALEWVTCAERVAERKAFVWHQCGALGDSPHEALSGMVWRMAGMPQEGQKQQRLLHTMAERWVATHQDAHYSVESVGNLMCSLYMLNTMLHNPAAKNHAFTIQQWVQHASTMPLSPDDATTFPKEMLEEAYECIREEPLQCASHPLDMPRDVLRHGLVHVKDVGGGEKVGKKLRQAWAVMTPEGVLSVYKSTHERTPMVAMVMSNTRWTPQQDGGDMHAFVLETPKGYAMQVVCSSDWSYSRWASVIKKLLDRPFPGIPVHDVPANSTPTRIIPRSVFDSSNNNNNDHHNELSDVHKMAPLSPRKRVTELVVTSNPVYHNEALIMQTPPRPTMRVTENGVVEVTNPVFRDSYKRVANPLYKTQRSSPDLLSPSSPGPSISPPSRRMFQHRQSMPDLSQTTPLKRMAFSDPNQQEMVQQTDNPLFGLGDSVLKREK